MVDDLTRADSPEPAGEEHVIESTRMSFGDHLDELRTRLLWALGGVAAAAVGTLMVGRGILDIIFRPLWTVQFANGLQPNLQVLAPTDAFTAYLKISFLSALIVAMPWVLYHLWSFVATGLYTRERRFITGVIASSVGMFIIGVMFLYFLVLPLVLQFFITFNRAFGPADLNPSALQSLLLAREPVPAVTLEEIDPQRVRIVGSDPQDAPPGAYWINAATRRLMFQTSEGPWSIALEPGTVSPAMQSQFAVDQYVSFVLVLALAFGLAFETPIVVVFLSWSGLASVATMAGARRYVILGTVVASAVMTPSPDVLNQLLLAVPMYLLFEIGLRVARLFERRRAEATPTAS